MTPTIEAHGLEKRYGKTTALDGLDLVAEAGQVVAVLGPNGAGKTTFVRAVATLLRLDGGTLRVAGHDVRREPDAVRRSIGLAGQFAAVEPAMTGRENLEMVARLFGRDRRTARAAAADVLATLALTDDADRLVRTYSGGMRPKLDLGASLVGSPRLLLLDEPTTGLDPRSRMDLWDAIRALVEAGTDVLLTTQYLDEADNLASQIVIIDHGRAVATGTPAELKRRIGGNVIEVHARRRDDLATVAIALDGLAGGEAAIDEATRRVTVGVDSDRAPLVSALRSVEAAGVEIDDIAMRQPTLDEVFLALTGRAAAGGTAKVQPHDDTRNTHRPQVVALCAGHAHRGPPRGAALPQNTPARRPRDDPDGGLHARVPLRLRRRDRRREHPVRRLRRPRLRDDRRALHGHRRIRGRRGGPRAGVHRPAAIAPDPAQLGARGSGTRRHGDPDLEPGCHRGDRVPGRVPAAREPAGGAGRVRPGRPLRIRVRMDVHRDGALRPHAAGRAGLRPAGVPADVPLERVRPGRLDAAGAPALRGIPADHVHGRRRARADAGARRLGAARAPGGVLHHAGARVGRRHPGRLGAAVSGPVPAR